MQFPVKMTFFDMHTHLLPDFDDGAESIDKTLELIDCLKEQGVYNICFTPHFYSNEMSAEKFLSKRSEAFERFLPFKPADVNIVLGAEVYVSKYLLGNDDLSGITYGNSRYILTEFAYGSEFSEHTMQRLYSLIENHGLIPVIPHIERYVNAMSNISIIYELKNMGVLIQSNTLSYAKKSPIFRRKKLLKLIDLGLIDILGTDAHSFTHNSPKSFSQAIDCITEKCGTKAVNRLMQNAEKIFNAAIS